MFWIKVLFVGIFPLHDTTFSGQNTIPNFKSPASIASSNIQKILNKRNRIWTKTQMNQNEYNFTATFFSASSRSAALKFAFFGGSSLKKTYPGTRLVHALLLQDWLALVTAEEVANSLFLFLFSVDTSFECKVALKPFGAKRSFFVVVSWIIQPYPKARAMLASCSLE